MKNKYWVIGLIIVISSILLFAYDSISNNNQLKNTVFDSSLRVNFNLKHFTATDSIIPLDRTVKKKLAGTIFGYLPEWKLASANESIRYDLLTHVAAFDFFVNPDASLSMSAGWPWTDVINQAHHNGVRVIMTAFSENSGLIHRLLTEERMKNIFFENVTETISIYKLDGVNIDFEDIDRVDRGRALNSFMQELRSYIKMKLPEAEISFAGPAVNWGGWDFVGLAAAVDYIFIMGYDYYDRYSPVSGPASSLYGPYYSVSASVLNRNHGYGKITELTPEKLILGVPYYGYHWITETEEVHSPNIEFVEHTQYKYNAVDVLNYKRKWDSNYKMPWYKYKKDDKWHQIWYEDNRSLGMKYDFAISQRLRGVGMWALGYDGNRPELWHEIQKRFVIRDDYILASSKYQPERATGLPFTVNPMSTNPLRDNYGIEKVKKHS